MEVAETLFWGLHKNLSAHWLLHHLKYCLEHMGLCMYVVFLKSCKQNLKLYLRSTIWTKCLQKLRRNDRVWTHCYITMPSCTRPQHTAPCAGQTGCTSACNCAVYTALKWTWAKLHKQGVRGSCTNQEHVCTYIFLSYWIRANLLEFGKDLPSNTFWMYVS